MHMNTMKRILHYLKGTLSYGLVYSRGSSNNMLSGYSHCDLVGAGNDRESTGGMTFYHNDILITWVSQMHRYVALSSCEAEF